MTMFLMALRQKKKADDNAFYQVCTGVHSVLSAVVFSDLNKKTNRKRIPPNRLVFLSPLQPLVIYTNQIAS